MQPKLLLGSNKEAGVMISTSPWWDACSPAFGQITPRGHRYVFNALDSEKHRESVVDLIQILPMN